MSEKGAKAAIEAGEWVNCQRALALDLVAEDPDGREVGRGGILCEAKRMPSGSDLAGPAEPPDP